MKKLRSISQYYLCGLQTHSHTKQYVKGYIKSTGFLLKWGLEIKLEKKRESEGNPIIAFLKDLKKLCATNK